MGAERGVRFRTDTVPAFRAHLRTRNELLTAQRERLRLDDYKPAVMSGFVRNRLLDESYLRQYWAETVETLGARRVVLTHWDDFFGPGRDLVKVLYIWEGGIAVFGAITGGAIGAA